MQTNGSGDADLRLLDCASVKLAMSGPATSASITSAQFDATVSGSGDLHTTGISLKDSGSGDARLAGSSGAIDVARSGSGNLDGQALTVARAVLRSASSGDMQLDTVSESLLPCAAAGSLPSGRGST